MTRYAKYLHKVSTPPRLPSNPGGDKSYPRLPSNQPTARNSKDGTEISMGGLRKCWGLDIPLSESVWLVVVVVVNSESQLVSHLQRVRTSDLRITKYSMCTLGWESPKYDQYPRSYHRSPSQSLCSVYASGNFNPDSLRGLPRNGWVLLTWILVRHLIRFRTALNFPRLVNQSLVLCCTNDWLESLWLHPARWSF